MWPWPNLPSLTVYRSGGRNATRAGQTGRLVRMAARRAAGPGVKWQGNPSWGSRAGGAALAGPVGRHPGTGGLVEPGIYGPGGLA